MASFKGSAMEPTPGRNPARIGHIPGFPVSFEWPSRRELCNDGVHPYLVRGIHGRAKEGAFSVVVSGGYEDDCDLGDTITYTGEGGALRHADGKWVDNAHNGDQSFERGGNRALQTSHQTGDPVRVIRGHSLNSPYAPKKGSLSVRWVIYRGFGRTGCWKEPKIRGLPVCFQSEASHWHASYDPSLSDSHVDSAALASPPSLVETEGSPRAVRRRMIKIPKNRTLQTLLKVLSKAMQPELSRDLLVFPSLLPQPESKRKRNIPG